MGAIFLGEARIVDTAEVDVASRAARADYDGFPGLDVQLLTLVVDRDADHRPTRLRLADDRRHPMLCQNLDAELAR